MRSSYQTLPPQGQQDQALEPFLQAFVDFLRVRLLNFAVAGLLTLGYLLYQYWGLLFSPKPDEDEYEMHLPRSRSRSRTRERDYRHDMGRHGRGHSHRRQHGRRHGVFEPYDT